jgi:hypothetical protein
MSYRVFVKAAVANLREGGTGTRKVLLKSGQILEFSRTPTVLDELPPEVEADEYLIKEPIAPAAATQSGASDQVDLSKLPWNELVRGAKKLGIETQGVKRSALEPLVAAKLAALQAPDPGSESTNGDGEEGGEAPTAGESGEPPAGDSPIDPVTNMPKKRVPEPFAPPIHEAVGA